MDLNITTMKAIIYARVSSAGDRQSTTRQVADLTKYAKFKEYEVVRILKNTQVGEKRIVTVQSCLKLLTFVLKWASTPSSSPSYLASAGTLSKCCTPLIY